MVKVHMGQDDMANIFGEVAQLLHLDKGGLLWIERDSRDHPK